MQHCLGSYSAVVGKHVNPFVVAGELAAEDMIDREREPAELLAHARAGQPFRLVGPSRYGKTTLLARALSEADEAGIIIERRKSGASRLPTWRWNQGCFR
jgi:hypothetical protein